MSFDYSRHLDSLPRFFPIPLCQGVIRQSYADFEVTETLTFEPSGEGEHVFLYIEKNQVNTDWVANQLQRLFKLRSQDVGYAGKKDRHSLSRQWFSLHIPGNPDLTELLASVDSPFIKLRQSVRHNKKLRRGVIEHNHFSIRLSQLNGQLDVERLDQIKAQGFPNYFGAQRFGHNASNLEQADKLLKGQIRVRSRNKQGLYFSAARSFLFNLQLAERLSKGLWNQPVAGDCLMLDGSQSFFECQEVDLELIQRFNDHDLHASGWMPGKQTSKASLQALQMESDALLNHQDWLDGLIAAGVDSARRAFRVIPQDLHWLPETRQTGVLQFSLPTGCFATSLLRELLIFQDASLLHDEIEEVE